MNNKLIVLSLGKQKFNVSVMIDRLIVIYHVRENFQYSLKYYYSRNISHIPWKESSELFSLIVDSVDRNEQVSYKNICISIYGFTFKNHSILLLLKD